MSSTEQPSPHDTSAEAHAAEPTQPTGEAAPPDNGGAGSRTLSSRFRRLAPLILAAGAAAAILSVVPHLPRDRQVELRLEDASSITGLNLDWSPTSGSSLPSADTSETLQGSSWHFLAGTAPRSLNATVRLPDGSYNVDIRIERAGKIETSRRSITLGDSDKVTVPIR